MVDNAVTFAAVLLWLTAGLEGIHVARRRQPNHALDMLALTFVFLAISATFFVPAVQVRVQSLLGVPNISEPIARTALLGAAWSAPVLLLWLTNTETARHRARRRALVLVAFLVSLWTLFLLSPTQRPSTMFTRDFGGDVTAAAYLLTSVTYLAFALVDVLRGSWRYSRSARPAMRTALRLIGLGCVLGLAYVAVTATYVGLLVTGNNPSHSRLESNLGRLLAVGGGLLVIAGSAFPFLAARTERARTSLRTYRELRGLYPLWLLLYRAAPDIALDPPASAMADALGVRDVRLRLYRRVIEIRDARLALAAYLDPEVAARIRQQADVAGMAADVAAARAEAALLIDAVARNREGHPVEEPAPPPPAAAGSLAEEVDWFLRVTHEVRLLTRSPDAPVASEITPRTAE